MNKLEEKFKRAFDEQYQKFRHVPTYKELAHVAAELALEIVEKAFVTGRSKISWEEFKKEIL